MFDASDHRIEVGNHLIVPETKDPIALLFEIPCAPLVDGDAFGMLAAIDFDDETGGNANEIRHIGTNGHLSPELGASKLLGFDRQPELSLLRREVAAKLLGKSARRRDRPTSPSFG
jgi:hypothetical protein